MKDSEDTTIPKLILQIIVALITHLLSAPFYTIGFLIAFLKKGISGGMSLHKELERWWWT